MAKLIKIVSIIHRPMLISGFANEKKIILRLPSIIYLSPFLFSVIYSLGDSLNYTWKIMNLISEGSLESMIYLNHLGWDTFIGWKSKIYF